MSDQYPNHREVSDWASTRPGAHQLSRTGRLPRALILAWNKAHPNRPYVASQAHHGTTGGYNRGCGCPRCTAANRARVANYTRAGGSGRWDDFEGDVTP